MSFALKQLSRLLSQDTYSTDLATGGNTASVLGSVVELNVDGGLVRIATHRGAVTARPADSLVVGQRVVVSSGVAYRAPVATQSFPV